MGDKAITYLIDAEDYASEKFQDFYRTLSQGSKNVLEMAGQFKEATGQAIQFADSIGLIGLDRFAENIAAATDIVANYNIDLRETGSVAFETKAAMAQLAFTVGMEVGKAFSEAAMDTQYWNLQMEHAIELQAKLLGRVASEITTKKSLKEVETDLHNLQKEKAELEREGSKTSLTVAGVGAVAAYNLSKEFITQEKQGMLDRAKAMEEQIAQTQKLYDLKVKEKMEAEAEGKETLATLTGQNKAIFEQYQTKFMLVDATARERDIQEIMAKETNDALKAELLARNEIYHNKLDAKEAEKERIKAEEQAAKEREKMEKKHADEKEKAQQKINQELEKEADLYNKMVVSMTELLQGKEAAAQLEFEQGGLSPEKAKQLASIGSLVEEIKSLGQQRQSSKGTDANKFIDQRFGSGRTEADARRRDAEELQRLAKDRNSKLDELRKAQEAMAEAFKGNEFVIGTLGD